MTGFFKKNYDYILLVIILITATVMRFHMLGDISFSNDELSALTRTRFETFNELVEKGIKVDGHPFLVQTMMWYTVHHFGDDVFTVRFMFAIAGILSVFFLFLLGRSWFGKATGLLSAAALATLIFPLLYSQTARPYIIGSMFSLAMAYCWTIMLFGNKHRLLATIGYILSAAGCIHSHYFSFLLAGIIGISGLFFMKKEDRKSYIAYNLLLIPIFLPSLPTFMIQIGYGGIGGWLPPPDGSFLRRFIFYVFNESRIITVLFIAILVTSMALFYKKSGWKKFHTLSLLWFLLSFATGYLYSIFVAPVIQFSTLLFSFPFLLLFLFSFINEAWVSKNIIVLLTLIVLSVGAFSTVVRKKYYTTNHFGVFKELADKTKEWDNKYGKENVKKMFVLSNPLYINYYFKRMDYDPAIDIYTDNERDVFAKLYALIDTTHASYFSYAWTNSPHFYETFSLITEKFPVVVERDTFFNSEITLFGRGQRTNHERIISSTDLETDNWNYETKYQSNEQAHSGMYSEKMEEREYSVGFRTSTEKLNLNNNEALKAEAWFHCSDSLRDAALVISFQRNDEVVLYNSVLLKNFFHEKNKWTRALLFSDVPPGNCDVSIYIWNPKHEIFYTDDISVIAEQKSSLYRP